MRKRIALLAMMTAVLLFTIALVAFSVFTVNATTVTTAAVNHPAAVNAAVTTDSFVVSDVSSNTPDSLIVSDVSSNTADPEEDSVQYVGRLCHGDEVDDYAY